MQSLLILAGVLLVFLGLWMDSIVLVCSFRRLQVLKRPSGIPVIPILLHVGGLALLPTILFGVHKGFLLVALVCYHIAAVFIIPAVTRKLARSNNPRLTVPHNK